MAKKADHIKIPTKDIAEMIRKGYPVNFVAKHYGVTSATIINRLRRDGYDRFGNKID